MRAYIDNVFQEYIDELKEGVKERLNFHTKRLKKAPGNVNDDPVSIHIIEEAEDAEFTEIKLLEE